MIAGAVAQSYRDRFEGLRDDLDRTATQAFESGDVELSTQLHLAERLAAAAVEILGRDG